MPGKKSTISAEIKEGYTIVGFKQNCILIPLYWQFVRFLAE